MSKMRYNRQLDGGKHMQGKNLWQDNRVLLKKIIC